MTSFQTKKNAAEMKKVIRETLVLIGITLVLFLMLRIVMQTYIINGTSMEPSLLANQRVAVNKAVYYFRQPQRGEVVILLLPRADLSNTNKWLTRILGFGLQSDRSLIKRAVGLPGEEVIIKDEHVYIYSQDGTMLLLDEPYIMEPTSYVYDSGIIPPNSYLVLGDNRNVSIDSHQGWTVSKDHIVGKAWLRFWPLGTWTVIDRTPATEIITNTSN